MAHNLYERLDGKAAMMYTGEVPWHGLGTKLDNPATAKEAINVAGLDYEVDLKPIHRWNNFGTLVEIPNFRVTVNRENDAELGIVGDGYKIIQNRDAFSFFDSVVGEGQAIYHTAGALGKGERIWILAKLPGEIVVANNDRIEKYMALMTSHDGKSSLTMWFTPTRIVCMNTLTAALKGFKSSEGIKIRHSGDVRSKINAAQSALQIAGKYYDVLEAVSKQFVEYTLTAADIDTFLKSLVPDESMKAEAVEEARLTVGFLAAEGRGQKGVSEIKDTAWAYLNGASEYADYYRRGMGQDVDASKKLASKWIGSSAKFKARAFSLLGDLVGVN